MATWSVNSYSYPNPFDRQRGIDAWNIFETFTQHVSYGAVKDAMTGDRSAHAVESWKANFEELGLLYVLNRDDSVHITDGGRQLIAAAASGNQREFAWVGLNLLLRYPLRGTAGRRGRGDEAAASDLLLYWFVLAAALELDGFWQSELFRVLATTFSTTQAADAIASVRRLRAAEIKIDSLTDEVSAGGTYNSINQIVVKAGLNHMIFTSTRDDSPYFPETTENMWRVVPEYLDLVELALGHQPVALPAGCAETATLMERMPPAPPGADEQSYFDYLGAPVTPLADAEEQVAGNGVQVSTLDGELVYLLSGPQFDRVDALRIRGTIHMLCVLAPGQRVLLADDLAYTYIVEEKTLGANATVVVRLRRARPIVDSSYVAGLFMDAPSV